MNPAVEVILTAYEFNLRYAQELVADVPEERMYESFGDGLENHPGFTLGHLTIASALIAMTLGAEYEVPDGWDDFFRRKGPGDPRRPMEFNQSMPNKAELLAALQRKHEQVAELARQQTEQQLARPLPWRFQQHFPDNLVYLSFMCITHEALHLGQVAAWRRAAGLDSALAKM